MLGWIKMNNRAEDIEDEIILPILNVRYITIKTFCRLTGITKDTIYKRISNGTYPPNIFKKIEGGYMVDYKAHDKFVKDYKEKK